MNNYSKCKVCNNEVAVVNETYHLGKCISCGLIFCLDIFTQEEFVKVYDDLYNKEKSVYQRHSSDEYSQILKKGHIPVGLNRSLMIKNNILNNQCQSVLEIGSGIGLVGAYIRSKNEKIKYVGIEIDKETFLKSQQLKLNTFNGDFTEMNNLEGTFDAIMMWEVIEHLQDLKLFLELAYKKLNKNGKIILSTPHYNKIYNYPDREKDRLYQNEPPIHINFFTEENIKNIFELHNFGKTKVTIKKFPYLELTKKRFYVNFVKALFGKYYGPTIFFEATKL